MSEFKCPKCGGCMFGTSSSSDWDNAIGHCHGFNKDGSRCNFTWSMVSNDSYVMTEEPK